VIDGAHMNENQTSRVGDSEVAETSRRVPSVDRKSRSGSSMNRARERPIKSLFFEKGVRVHAHDGKCGSPAKEFFFLGGGSRTI
jgi:hypothetical protein